MNSMNIRGQWVEGEIHLSLTTIKQILTADLVDYLEARAEGKTIPNSIEYIKNFIERINNVPDLIPDEKKWWEMF